MAQVTTDPAAPPRAAAGRTCLMVFAKAPVEGSVKTRLAAALGKAAATGLYRAFVSDLLQTLAQTGYPVQIHFWPPTAGPVMQQWLGSGYEFLPQKPGDLGRKMADAFTASFAGDCEKAILIGTDFPDLPGGYIHEAFHALTGRPAVIGPSMDGGYVLIGFTRHGFQPAAFRDIPWGSPAVFEKTVAVFKNHETPVHYLPAWWDIDTFADLARLACRLKQNGTEKAPETARLLMRLGYLEVCPMDIYHRLR